MSKEKNSPRSYTEHDASPEALLHRIRELEKLVVTKQVKAAKAPAVAPK